MANCNKKRKVRLAHKIAFVKDYDRIRTVVWLPVPSMAEGYPLSIRKIALWEPSAYLGPGRKDQGGTKETTMRSNSLDQILIALPLQWFYEVYRFPLIVNR